MDTIGNTPLVRIGKIYAKLETVNPTGSIKDRIALYMTRKAEERNELKPGGKIIEATSGNTGISFAMVSAMTGYKFTAVMPESMSVERIKIMKAFGASVFLTPASENMGGAVKKYEEIAKSNPDAWLPRQFENPDNIMAHKEGLGSEILEQMQGNAGVFVAGIGTGGTLIGVAKALEEAGVNAKIVGIEPAESPILSKGYSGFHGIQGIGEGFIPKLVEDNLDLIDEVITVRTKDAIRMTRRLIRTYGLLVGISSGANVLVSMEMARRFKNVVTVLPDRGERYLSLW